MIDWTRYGYCEACEQRTGQPCRDLRYRDTRSGSSHVLPNTRPHRGRPRITDSEGA